MKTNIFKQAKLFLCIVAAAFTISCTNNDNNSNNIVGNWLCVSRNGNGIENDRLIAFREDKAYTDRTGLLIHNDSYDCKWSVVDNYLYIDYTYMEDVYGVTGIVGREEYHKTREFEILELTNTSLKLQRDSDRWEFNRE